MDRCLPGPAGDGGQPVPWPDPLEAVARCAEGEGPALSPERLVTALQQALGADGVGLYDRAGRLLAAAPPPAGPELRRLPDYLASALARLAEPLFDQAVLQAGPDGGWQPGLGPLAAAVPVVGGGRRLGTLLVWGGAAGGGRAPAQAQAPEQAQAQSQTWAAVRLAATVLGLAMAFQRAVEEEGASRSRQLIRAALSSLSFSEALAAYHLLHGLQGEEGRLVASRIAQQAGVTRSVVVNALRKLASARLLESRSLGKRGTYLRILNPQLREELLRHGPGRGS